MAEPDPRTPHGTPLGGTASWEAAPPVDVGAVEGTISYPDHPTASFHRTDAPPAPTFSDTDNQTAPNPAELPQIPGYELLGILGGGGMGVVYKARHSATNRVVALKLINPSWAANPDFRARFAREAEALAALEHPNIVPI